MKNITSGQMRAARGLLGISAQELADMANVGVATVRRAEGRGGTTLLRRAVHAALVQALESAGVEFIDANGKGPGVRLRAS